MYSAAPPSTSASLRSWTAPRESTRFFRKTSSWEVEDDRFPAAALGAGPRLRARRAPGAPDDVLLRRDRPPPCAIDVVVAGRGVVQTGRELSLPDGASEPALGDPRARRTAERVSPLRAGGPDSLRGPSRGRGPDAGGGFREPLRLLPGRGVGELPTLYKAAPLGGRTEALYRRSAKRGVRREPARDAAGFGRQAPVAPFSRGGLPRGRHRIGGGRDTEDALGEVTGGSEDPSRGCSNVRGGAHGGDRRDRTGQRPASIGGGRGERLLRGGRRGAVVLALDHVGSECASRKRGALLLRLRAPGPQR